MKNCEICNQQLSKKQSYTCSLKCKLKRQTKDRKNCLKCGNKCKNHNAIYCSQLCGSKDRIRKNLESWLSGSTTQKEHAVKGFLICLHGNKCSVCGWCAVHPVTGNIPVEMDHIDGDWTNNSPSNVRLLCPNCHSLTHTYRALNKRLCPRKAHGSRKPIKVDQ